MSAEKARADSAAIEFWDSRYRDACTPWDAGGVPEDFARWLEVAPQPGRILIPGCGSAYEAAALAHRGWPVEAIDYSPSAVARARTQLGPWGNLVREADFFAFDFAERYPVVYERAFLCALPPRLWADYAKRMAELIAPGGSLLGYFFVAPEGERGPPFPIAEERLQELLAGHFERLEDRASCAPLPVFGGRERWQIWRRRISL